ncbi:unnamed protein product, partial [Sphagnum jensenii]
MLAVVGMGGIGKTTLVKELYHQIHADFKKSSFLENVKKSDIVEVKKKLIMDLCGFELSNQTTYLKCFKECWIDMKILVVIDDVEEIQIIELLGKDMDGITRNENGSRIIMTGRNWKDFENVIPKDGKFGMEGLNEKQAMELFSWKAFRQSIPPHDFASITNEVVHACQGLPLTLEVTGSWLCTKTSSQEWKESLLRLKNAQPFGGGRIENDKLWGRLRICYDDLAREEREMFLDIACFFSEYNSKFEGIWTRPNGITIQKALQIWKVPSQCSPKICLQNLMDRSLAKENDKGNLVMHDQLRDMGRQILPPSITNLYPLSKLDLRHCKSIESLPPTIDQFQHLTTLILGGCENLKELPPNIASLSSLSSLDLSSCKSIESLPTTIGQLEHLTQLSLSRCENIKELPQSIANLSSLLILDLSYCKSIESLPTTIGQLKHLTHLLLQGCENLKELPQTITNLSSLSTLDLSHCKSIESLPITIGQFQHFTKLQLKGCENLKELPQSITNLSSLSTLDLSYCKSIESLPTTIGQLKHLSNLLLQGCENLKELPLNIANLSSLSMMDLSHCKSIESLPTTIGELKHLIEIKLEGCENLKELPPNIANLSSLSIMDLSFCKSMESLPTTIGQLQYLTELKLKGCENLKELPQSITSLFSLSILDLSSLWRCSQGLQRYL